MDYIINMQICFLKNHHNFGEISETSTQRLKLIRRPYLMRGNR